MSVISLSSGKFKVDIRNAYKKRIIRVFKDKNQAKLFEASIISEVPISIPHSPPVTASSIKFSYILKQYFDFTYRDKEVIRSGQKYIIDKLIKEIGHINISDLNRQIFETYLVSLESSTLTKTGQRPSISYINNIIIKAKSALNYAVAFDIIKYNPISSVKKRRDIMVRDFVLNPQSLSNLFSHLPPHLLPIITCAYETAMRISEVLSLRWYNIDMVDRVIYLSAENTKAKYVRVIPISSTLHTVLSNLTNPHNGRAFVFLYRGKRIRSCRSAFNRAVVASGLDNFHIHDLRRQRITDWRRAGFDFHTISKVSGHKTDAVFRRYSVVDIADVKSIVK